MYGTGNICFRLHVYGRTGPVYQYTNIHKTYASIYLYINVNMNLKIQKLCLHIYMHTYIYIYTYIYIEREREREFCHMIVCRIKVNVGVSSP